MPVVVIENRGCHCMMFAKVGVLCRGVDESTILVASEMVSQPQNMVGSSRSGRDEHNAKTRTGAEFTCVLP